MIGTEALLDFLRDRQDIRLVGIDGLPVSGKSTLADRLIETFGAEVIYLDDFVLPQDQWPEPIAPGFPFPYIRHEAFFAAVETLVATDACRYQLYDWESGALGPWKEVRLGGRLVVVEGVSALAERIVPLYDLKVWVESDPITTLSASLARGVGAWERQWRELFMPSVEAYLQTRPKDRADLILAGRCAQI
ncbi:MAG: uridine kinase family protein [Devosia sp.]